MQKQARIGIDIGGTFTDFVLETTTRQVCLKLLTTPDAPERAVLDGLVQVLREAALAPSDVVLVVHGTTLATNAVIERKGAKVAFLTTEGFRDVLEVGYENRYDQYDLLVNKPLPLVPRRLRLPVPERCAADGRVLKPLDPQAIIRHAAMLAGDGVEAVAVGLLHAYANPAHEQAVAALLAAHLPGVPVSLSSDVSPEIREYERFTTVSANAYVQPLMARYLGRLRDAMVAMGIAAPLLLMQSNGGLCDVETAIHYPVRLLESGPAGGAMFAASVARELGLDRALMLDIGGTTAKLCFLDEGAVQTTRSLEVARIDRFKPGSGLPLRFPVLELCEIGAGGGSIAAIDRLGRLRVGPQSAGAVPGPACYGHGTAATVTDANLALGRLHPERFADGTIRLDAARAAAALLEQVARPGDMAVQEAAAGVVEIVNENMANAAREHAIEVGRSLAGRTLIAIGGAAALHAADLARTLDMAAVVVPPAAGVGSAVGFLRAPIAFEKSLSHYLALDSLAPAALATVRRLMQETAAVPRAETAAPDLTPPDLTLAAQMRYRGQGHEITVPVDPAAIETEGASHLRTRFEAAYRRLYGRLVPNGAIEILGWTARAELPAGARRPPPPPPAAVVPPVLRPMTEQRDLASVEARWFARTALAAGEAVPGPAVIADAGTTIIVPGGHRAEILRGGHVHLRGTAP